MNKYFGESRAEKAILIIIAKGVRAEKSRIAAMNAERTIEANRYEAQRIIIEDLLHDTMNEEDVHKAIEEIHERGSDAKTIEGVFYPDLMTDCRDFTGARYEDSNHGLTLVICRCCEHPKFCNEACELYAPRGEDEEIEEPAIMNTDHPF